MATHGRTRENTVAQQLDAEGHRFEFYQAVRLLELLQPQADSVGASMPPWREAVRFRSTVGFEFLATEVAETKWNDNDSQTEMTVNFMGLAGIHGPLPVPYTRLLLERLRHDDTILRDFLDIFNHRLISLLYRVRRTHRVGFDHKPPGEDRFARYFFSLLGLGTEGLRHRMAVPDRTLLRYTGLLAHEPRSAIGLECLLKDYFKVNVKVRQFQGEWLGLNKDQWTALGVSGRNQRLGDSFVLGKSVYDVQGKFEVCLGPLTLKQFCNFLPKGQAYAALCDLTRFYVHQNLTFDLRLTLKATDIPEFRLSTCQGRENVSSRRSTGSTEFWLNTIFGSRLGWTTWLKTDKSEIDESGPKALRVSEKGSKVTT